MINTLQNDEKTPVLSKRKQRKQDELAKILNAQERKENALKSQQILEYIEKNKDDVEWVKVLEWRDLDERIIKFKNWELVRWNMSRGSEYIEYLYKPDKNDGKIEIDKHGNELFQNIREVMWSLCSSDLECKDDEWAKYTRFIPELYK